MYSEVVELRGHIIDSLILPKVLDEIMHYGGTFEITEIQVGQKRSDPSYARLRVEAAGEGELAVILGRIKQHGATILREGEVVLEEVRQPGVFPEGFYCTTNLPTRLRYGGRWLEVEAPEMDCGILVERQRQAARCLPVHRALPGQWIVVGHQGVWVSPLERASHPSVFEFMTSSVSSEKPKGVVIQQIADHMRQVRQQGEQVLLVAGPAVVHTGAGQHLARLIEAGWINLLFAGNALAVHDIEQALYGTSLGISLDKGVPAVEGHEHHMRAINTIRRHGGIAAAVQAGVLKSGIMYSCVRHGVDVLLAGSIRDDGPLPEVVTNCLQAQELMRQRLHAVEERDRVGICLMVATALHAIATGNLLPSRVKTICVDINPAVVTKLTDRGSFQAIGLVTDAEAFLRELAAQLLPARPLS